MRRGGGAVLGEVIVSGLWYNHQGARHSLVAKRREDGAELPPISHPPDYTYPATPASPAKIGVDQLGG